jgi:hypothetical protein
LPKMLRVLSVKLQLCDQKRLIFFFILVN